MSEVEEDDLVLDYSLFNDTLNQKLREFQKYGILKITAAYLGGFPGFLLSDDMGLGKTAQALVSISFMLKHIPLQSFLIAVRNEEHISSWERECETWLRLSGATPSVYKLTTTRTKQGRLSLLSKVIQYGGICLMTHGMVRSMIDEIEDLEFNVIVIDEAHHILNPKSKTRQAFDRLSISRFRLCLSATPSPGDPVQLYRLISYIDPDVLGTEAEFKKSFAKDIKRGHDKSASDEEKECMKELTQEMLSKIGNIFAQRGKELLTLPDKREYVIWVPLSDQQQKIYKFYTERAEIKRIADSRLLSTHPPFLLKLLDTVEKNDYVTDLELHNYKKESTDVADSRFDFQAACENLIKSEVVAKDLTDEAGDEEVVLSDGELEPEQDDNAEFIAEDVDHGVSSDSDEDSSSPLPRKITKEDLFESIVDQSPKLRILMILLTELIADGHSVLVFVQRLFTMDVLLFSLQSCWYPGN
ncbi:hypothetical protein GEMRC1_002572 [Eukaryota sp. GEM-RC1]